MATLFTACNFRNIEQIFTKFGVLNYSTVNSHVCDCVYVCYFVCVCLGVSVCLLAGTVQVSVSASDLELDEGQTSKQKSRPNLLKDREQRLVKQLNIEMLETTLAEVRNFRRVVASGCEPRSLERRKSLLRSIRQLMRYRREITDIYEGSVVFCILCLTVRALADLRTLCRSGCLRDALRADFVTDSLLRRYRLLNLDFVVSFSEAEYQLCRRELGGTGL